MTLSAADEARLALASELILRSGRLALDYFADPAHLAVDSKLDGQDVVSAADRAVEALMREAIADAFPDDGFLGEEGGLTAGTSGRRWTVDPIDGTSCFVHGLSSWCLSIALSEEDGDTLFGLIHAPLAGELFTATRGRGAFLDGQPIAVDAGAAIADAFVGLGANHRVPPRLIASFAEALLSQGGMFVRSGSGALSLAEVACGRLAAYYEPHINAWDCLAGLLLVREAGGWTADFPGPGRTLIEGGPVAAAAPQLREPLLRLIDRSRRD